ncbi:hypothetical protein Tco_1517156 [Tanacetum coccineum]|uniref:Uncharacterized protein n=1 Tax=Tanacetum coccineum TaxID=301880 RepID=A0ABQ5C180_9ASTR
MLGLGTSMEYSPDSKILSSSSGRKRNYKVRDRENALERSDTSTNPGVDLLHRIVRDVEEALVTNRKGWSGCLLMLRFLAIR